MIKDSLEAGGDNELFVVVTLSNHSNLLNRIPSIIFLSWITFPSSDDFFWSMYLNIGSRLERVGG